MGRYISGRRYCVFAHDPSLLGFACWGRPDAHDVRELLHACEFGLKPDMRPYRWLVDVRGLELVEPATFGLFLSYTREHRERLRRNIQRQAQLRPEGIVGAILAGFSQVAHLPYSDRTFGDVEQALGWLGVEPSAGIELLAELEAIRNGALGRYAIVVRLRRELDAAGPLLVRDAARRLAVSTRTLQRALRDAGTTYRMELSSFRVRRAQELLRGDRSISWIATEVGFASAQHFATVYRRAVGETPTAWRERHR